MGAHMHKVAWRIDVCCHMHRKVLQLRLIGKIALLNLVVAIPEISQAVRGIPVQCLCMQLLRDVNNSPRPLSMQNGFTKVLQTLFCVSNTSLWRHKVRKFGEYSAKLLP